MSQLEYQKYLDILDRYMTEGRQKGYCHLSVEDKQLNGRTIKIQGRDLINFGSSSYLGLELDRRLILGTIEAAMKYGTQFSSSRAYLSSGQYLELETLLAEIFKVTAEQIIILPSTTLAHISAIPVAIEATDAIVLDRHVHASVSMSVNLLKSWEKRVEVVEIPHNRLDILEQTIKNLRHRVSRIWYAIDSIYSMHGDIAPLNDLAKLLNDHEQLYLYVDDAHGMSWQGERGCGSAVNTLNLHHKAIFATSLNKAFGAAGGALVFPRKEWSRRVRIRATPFIFTGAIQPPLLGACIASAKIHLCDELKVFQSKLVSRIEYCNELLNKYDLPIEQSNSPIFFINLETKAKTEYLAEKLLEDGYYIHVATFPAVPLKRSGIRFSLTLHHTLNDIQNLVEAIAEHLYFVN